MERLSAIACRRRMRLAHASTAPALPASGSRPAAPSTALAPPVLNLGRDLLDRSQRLQIGGFEVPGLRRVVAGRHATLETKPIPLRPPSFQTAGRGPQVPQAIVLAIHRIGGKPGRLARRSTAFRQIRVGCTTAVAVTGVRVIRRPDSTADFRADRRDAVGRRRALLIPRLDCVEGRPAGGTGCRRPLTRLPSTLCRRPGAVRGDRFT